MTKTFLSFLLAWAVFLVGGCAKEENKPAPAAPPVDTRPATTSESTLPTVSMKIGNETFELEIAANDSERQHGLMYRRSMPLDHGMIFVFGDERDRAFWMQNTLIPLDIVYVNAAGRVVSIKHGVPLQEEPTIPSDGPIKWAIELNDGVAAAIGLKVGSKLEIPAEARDPRDN